MTYHPGEQLRPGAMSEQDYLEGSYGIADVEKLCDRIMAEAPPVDAYEEQPRWSTDGRSTNTRNAPDVSWKENRGALAAFIG